MTASAPSGGVQPQSIKRNTAMSLAVQLTGAAFTAVLVIFLARRLGTHGYGVFSLAVGITSLVLLPSDFGISNSVARFVAEHRDEPGRIQSVVADGLRLKVLIALVASVLLAALARPIALAYGIPAATWPLRAMSLALFGNSVTNIGAVFTAIGRIDLQLRVAFIESVVEFTTSIALVLAGAGATGAAFGRASGYLVAAAATVFLLVRALGRGILPTTARVGADARRIAGYAGILLIVDGAYTAFTQIDVLVIGAYLGASAIGLFSAPIKLTVLLTYPGSAVAAGVAPRLARGLPGGPNVKAFGTGLRVLLIVQAAITAFIVGWAPLMVRVVLGPRYHESASVLRALAPYIFLSGFGALVSVSANYLGEARKRVPVALVTVVINLVIDIVLVPRIGVIGGAWGTDAAFALYALGHLYICQRALGIDLGPTAVSFVRTALAGGAMTGVLLLFGDSRSDLLRTAVGGVLGVILFGFVLWLTREVSASEARAALAGFRLPRPVARGGMKAER
ncbi:MAG: flippase [Solirubrobacteraceae bacterium]